VNTLAEVLEAIKADAIRAVTPLARCDGCGYWRPAASVTVVSIRGHRFAWCPGCNGQRQPHPEEIVVREGRHA
jgi:hypothetical protein